MTTIAPQDSGIAGSDRIDLEPTTSRVVVRHGDRTIADSTAALVLREVGHEPRYYLPRDDVRWEALVPIATRSHCPIKGDADEYWALAERPDVEVAWAYPAPFDYLAGIAGRVAFYSDRVDVSVQDAGD